MNKLAATSLAVALLAAAATSSAGAHEQAPGETSTRIFEQAVPNLPGKVLLASEVVYPPGGATPSHRHPSTAYIFAYVVSGEIESALDDEPSRIYKAGDTWSEAPGTRHRISRNASKTKPAKLLAVFVADAGGGKLVFPDPQ